MTKIILKSRSEVLIMIAKKGKNISHFAKEIGVSNGYLSQILNGKRNPSAVVAYKIAKGINLEINDVFIINHKEGEGQNAECTN